MSFTAIVILKKPTIFHYLYMSLYAEFIQFRTMMWKIVQQGVYAQI